MAVLFLVISHLRKSSLAWINYFFAIAVTSFGAECFTHSVTGSSSLSILQFIGNILVPISLTLCAVCSVPLYRRIHTHPIYDQLHEAIGDLRQAERRFETFMNEMPAAIAIIDDKDRFVYANNKLSKWLGAAGKTLAGTNLLDWLTGDTVAGIRRHIARARETGRKHEFINDFSENGRPSSWLIYVFPVNGLTKQPLLGLAAVDITEQIAMRSTDTLLAQMVRLSPDAIYTVSADSTVTSWNKSAERVFGYRADEIIGRPITLLAPPGRQHEVAAILKQLELGQVLTDREFVHMAKDGTIKHLWLSALKVKSLSGKGVQYAAIARDVSVAKRMQAQMNFLNRQLDLRAAQLHNANAELQAARDQAIEAANLKSAFVGSISHEIRTPLSGIMGLSELLLEKPLDADALDMAQIMHESAEALLTIVNDILDLSKLQSGRISLHKEPFSPADLVQDCVKLLSPAASGKKLNLETVIAANVPAYIYGDAFRVRQILLNLIGNAIKFTATGSIHVDVRLIGEDEKTLTLQFSVTDTGIGIARDERHLLFRPFARIEKSTRGIRGTGLGLTISKRFVELMQGNIEFESEKDRGSRFWFSIPFEKTALAAPLAQKPPLDSNSPVYQEALRHHAVLSVEDNPILADLTMQQLSRIGIKSERALCGADAIAILQKQNFDIVLMDINLPDMTGYDVTKVIRDTEIRCGLNRHIIIALTAGAMPGDRERAIEAGMDDHLAKPVSLAQLRGTLIRWLLPAPAIPSEDTK